MKSKQKENNQSVTDAPSVQDELPTKNMASKGTTHIKRSNKTDNSILNVYDDILFKKSSNYNRLHDLDVR